MNHRGLRITSIVAFFLSLVLFAIEVFYFFRIICNNHPVHSSSHSADDNSMLGIILLVFLMIWSLINLLPGLMILFFMRDKKFPVVLSIIQIVLVSLKFLLILYCYGQLMMLQSASQ